MLIIQEILQTMEKLEDHDVIFHDSNPLCGDSIDIAMKIDDNKVTDIKFDGKGCAICMACYFSLN